MSRRSSQGIAMANATNATTNRSEPGGKLLSCSASMPSSLRANRLQGPLPLAADAARAPRLGLESAGRGGRSRSERMRGLAAADPTETVFLRADRVLPYGEVLLVMDTIRSAGMTNVALVTVPLRDEDTR